MKRKEEIIIPEAANSMEQLRDETYVKAVFEGLGGVKGLVEGMREYHMVVVRMRAERADLIEKYPDRWVAMGRGGVLAVGDSMNEVLEEVERLGIDSGEIAVEFLDTTPPLLIL